MKVLVTGGKGQLSNEFKSIMTNGKAQIGVCNTADKEFIFIDIDELDITNLNEVEKQIELINPKVVINCAAYTNVDECENNKDIAFKVNTLGARNLAIACNEIGAKIVQVSTDYVFSGEGEIPFDEYDQTYATSIYGKTKLFGEQYVKEFCSRYFIVRTSWLYGKIGNNFVYTIMKLAKEKDEVNVVNDQIGNPTNANDLAYHILKLIDTEEYGIYHCTGNSECSWYEFAKKIVELSGEKCTIKPCTTEEFPRPARRPKYSSLDNMMLRCTVGDSMRNWEEAIENFMKEV